MCLCVYIFTTENTEFCTESHGVRLIKKLTNYHINKSPIFSYQIIKEQVKIIYSKPKCLDLQLKVRFSENSRT